MDYATVSELLTTTTNNWISLLEDEVERRLKSPEYRKLLEAWIFTLSQNGTIDQTRGLAEIYTTKELVGDLKDLIEDAHDNVAWEMIGDELAYIDQGICDNEIPVAQWPEKKLLSEGWTPSEFNFEVSRFTSLEESFQRGIDVVKDNLQKISPANVRTLGYPLGIARYGKILEEKGVSVSVSEPNGLGKVRVKFTVPREMVVCYNGYTYGCWFLAGDYDFLVPDLPVGTM